MTDKINKLRQRCFFDITIGDRNVGRIIFELFNDICPKTCDNFRSLCTGEKGIGKTTGKPLHYKNIIFHRVVTGFIIQSGDFSVGDGRGGESIYGGTFDDENFEVKHEKPFLLSMANRGKNTNGSQFFITLNPAPHLDGVHVVFGHVLSGQEIVREIESLPVDKKCKPLTDVMISNCGELIPQIKTKDKKKKHKKEKSRKSDGEVTTDEEDKDSEKDKKKKKHKKHKKEKKKKEENVKDDKEIEDMAIECSVRPEEVPEIPENKFLMREADENKGKTSREVDRHSEERRTRDWSRSGRKFKGRGDKRYRTPSPKHRYRSGSETPPHWKEEQDKLLNWKDVVSGKKKYNRERENRYSGRHYERREYFPRERFQTFRNRFVNESHDERQTEKKRVFREEPPNERHLRQNVSTRRNSDSDDNKRNNGISFVNQTESSPELQRHSLRSEVKLKTRKDSRDETNEENIEKSHLDLKDIPLPDDQKFSQQLENKNLNEMSTSDRRHNDDRDSKRISRRRRHSSDS